MASLPAMGLWTTTPYRKRGLFAYVISGQRLIDYYVPFVDEPEQAKFR
jgi:hypothetical protein